MISSFGPGVLTTCDMVRLVPDRNLTAQRLIPMADFTAFGGGEVSYQSRLHGGNRVPRPAETRQKKAGANTISTASIGLTIVRAKGR